MAEGVFNAIGTDPATNRILWPNSDAVRIVIQASPSDPDDVRGPALLANQRETRREPGCLEFTWFRSLEFPEHKLLLELWADQAVYNHHHHLRSITASAGTMSTPLPRRHGENGLEFYRRREFAHLYDRWVPADVADWSHSSIVWGA